MDQLEDISKAIKSSILPQIYVVSSSKSQPSGFCEEEFL